MSHSRYAPDTLRRATDWRDQAACRDEDSELFFPLGSTGRAALAQIEQAKTICRRCPSVQACLQLALDKPINDGIWGGLTEDERVNLRRSATRRQLTPDDVTKRADQARQPSGPRTLQGIFDERTVRLPGGHLAWTGSQQVSFRGRKYTAKQVAFTVDRGHFPDGRVQADCGITECALPAHLTDQEERRTGTTKALV